MSNDSPNTTPVTSDGILASLSPNIPVKSRKISFDIAPSAIFKVVGTLAAIWFVIHIFPVLILVALSLMLVATFNPMVRKLQARLGRSWAIVGIVSVVVVTFLGALAVMIPPLIHQGLAVLQNMPKYTGQLDAALGSRHINLRLQQQYNQLTHGSDFHGPELIAIVFGVTNGATAFVTVAILTIYMLIEGPRVSTELMRLLPRKERLPVRELGTEIGINVGGYMRGQIITSTIAGIFTFVALLLLGVPGALALGALAAIADAIPLIGLLIAIVPAALLALTISPAKAMIVIVVYLVYHQVESHLIAPRVYGNALGLSLSAIVISILIGVELMGTMGAVLALPVAAAIPALVRFVQRWHERNQPVDAESHLP